MNESSMQPPDGGIDIKILNLIWQIYKCDFYPDCQPKLEAPANKSNHSIKEPMSQNNETSSKSARRQWAELNTEGFPTLDELRQALVTFDSGDKSAAFADCENWNQECSDATGQHDRDLDDWYGGIEDAIEERSKFE